jgi:hypothetical protein
MVRFTLILMSLMALGCSEYDLKPGGDEGDFMDDTGVAGGVDADVGVPGVPGAFDGSIRGRICEPGGGWVVGAYVYTTYDSTGDGEHDARSEDETDVNGAFELSGLPTDTDYVVYAIKGSFEATFSVSVAGGLTEIPEEECMLEPPDIAVVSGDYDHIEDIIEGMGLEYTLFNGQFGSTEYLSFLRDPAAMAEFDIIFLNCGISDTWIYSYREEVRLNIREFVDNGGSIYASDWAYYFVEVPFPMKLEFYGEDSIYGMAQVGAAGNVSATVLDPSMEVIIGSAMAEINFDLDMWVVIEGVGAGTEVLLQGDVPIWDTWGSTYLYNVPISARFDIGEGRVIYTAFHNEHAATTLDMTDILEEIILSL